jgi:hypothetical protein
MTALHVELVLANVLLRLSQREIFIKLMLTSVPTVVHVQMFVQLRLYILISKSFEKIQVCSTGRLFLWFKVRHSQNLLIVGFLH